MIEVTELSWHGPIPAPQMLERYNQVVPNGAERLFARFEKETAHRHQRERRAQDYPFLDQLAGRAAALIFALCCLAVAALAIDRNQPGRPQCSGRRRSRPGST